MFEPNVNEDSLDAVIKVFGVGGGGGNAVNHMVRDRLARQTEEETLQNDNNMISGVEFFAINTDIQALKKSSVQSTIQIGAETTKGLGAGANPEVGRAAAEADKEAIRSALEGADMVFIAAGMGGGTGTGAAPIIAQVAKEEGILTVAVVTKPFAFEGKKRMVYAEEGIKQLSNHVDSLIVIPNEKLMKVLGKGVSLLQAFDAANDVLRNAVRGISDMITTPGMINVDFADVRTVMSEMGRAMMGSGVAEGEVGDGRAEKAAQDAVASPLLDDIDLTGAKGVLVNVTSGMNLSLDEFTAIGDTVRAFASEEANVVVGTTLLPELEHEIRVTVVATGIGEDENLADIKVVSDLQSPVRRGGKNPSSGFEGNQYENSHEQYESNKVASGDSSNRKPAVRKKEDLFEIPAYMRDNAD